MSSCYAGARGCPLRLVWFGDELNSFADVLEASEAAATQENEPLAQLVDLSDPSRQTSGLRQPAAGAHPRHRNLSGFGPQRGLLQLLLLGGEGGDGAALPW
jgi:hypothetical protein